MIWFMLNTCFPFGILEYLRILGKGCLNEYPPGKFMGSKSLTSFRGWQRFTCVFIRCCWEIKYTE